MSPRRKSTTTQPPLEEVVQHNCEQLKCIGEISARLDGQEKTDERIEKAVLDLVAQNNAERAQTASEFQKMTAELAKLSSVMEVTNKSNAAQIKNQTEILKEQSKNQTKMIEQLAHVVESTMAIKEQQDGFKKDFEKHTSESNAWKKDIEKRLNVLERTRHVWYVVGTIIMAILCALAYVATIADAFGSRSDKESTEITQPSNK